MGEPSDIEALLRGHFETEKKRRRVGWMKMASVLISTFAGAGWTARGYLNQIATKEDVAKLLNGQQEQIRGLLDTQRVHADRMIVVENTSSSGRDCCREQSRRVDILYQQPLTVHR